MDLSTGMPSCLQMGSYLRRVVQRFRLASAAPFGLVVAGEDLGDRGALQSPFEGARVAQAWNVRGAIGTP